ncbi:reprolysin-like metallopeptidase [Pseudomonas putida]|uniref:reprolysin-like metallopeptidase n=1 Tax=Pseudomonas putida TaxID=303 RepID=UPI001EE28FE0|nr:zinc-dependent metalloprotease family protein [Pseudomonas putida]MDD1994146.1 metallopeptidase [Pseudomonas putida]
MNKNICKVLVLGAILTMASACSSLTSSDNGTSSAVQQLFTLEPTPDRNALQKTATGYLATVLADPSTQEITWIKVNPALVSNETQALAVTLPNGKTAAFNLRDFNTLTAGIEGWVGYTPSTWKQTHAPASSAEMDNDPFYYLSIAKQGSRIVGNLVVEGQRYRIDPVGEGQYALVKVDESKLPPEGEPIRAIEGSIKASPASSAPASTHSIIRVLFVSTNQSRTKYPDYRLRVAQALQDANQYLRNSQVEVTYQLAGYYDANYNETGSYGAQLGELKGANTDLGRAVYLQRDALRADLVSMLSTFSEVCGVAYQPASGKQLGYSVFSCIGGTLAHELGHNLDGGHGLAGTDPSKGYNHGYEHASPKFHTIMRTSHGAIPYFSNPRIQHQGVAIGTVQNHDNARRFNEYRETVANFYPDPSPEIRLQLYGTNGRGCSVRLSPGGSILLTWFTECKDNDVNPVRVDVRDFYSGSTPRKLCFANILYTVNSCYEGSNFSGDFVITDVHSGSGRPEGFSFTKRLTGPVSRVSYE